jgi:hypothetical protein
VGTDATGFGVRLQFDGTRIVRHDPAKSNSDFESGAAVEQPERGKAGTLMTADYH